jgi:tRNA-dihydrouridine synthase
VHIPVIGNGDIREPADAARMIERRLRRRDDWRAAASNPWIRQIEQFAAEGRYDEPTDEDRHRLLAPAGYSRMPSVK